MEDIKFQYDNDLALALVGLTGFIIGKLTHWWLERERKTFKNVPCITITEFDTQETFHVGKLVIATGEAATRIPGGEWKNQYTESQMNHVKILLPKKIRVQDPHSLTSLGSRVIDPLHVMINAKKLINLRSFNQSLNLPTLLILYPFSSEKLRDGDRVTFIAKGGLKSFSVEYLIQGTKTCLLYHLKKQSQRANFLSKIFGALALIFSLKLVKKDHRISSNQNHISQCFQCQGKSEIVIFKCKHFNICIKCFENLSEKVCPICNHSFDSFAYIKGK